MHMISAKKRRDRISWTKETISSSRLPALRHNHINDKNTFNTGNLDNQQTFTATHLQWVSGTKQMFPNLFTDTNRIIQHIQQC